MEEDQRETSAPNQNSCSNEATLQEEKDTLDNKESQENDQKERENMEEYQNQRTTKKHEHYKRCQKEAKQDVRQAKKDFERKLAPGLAQNIKEDSKSFYAYVRSKQKIKDAVGPLKTETGETIPPGQQTTDTLNNFFASVFTEERDDVPTLDHLHST